MRRRYHWAWKTKRNLRKVRLGKRIRVSPEEAERLIEEALEPKIKDISYYPEFEPDGPPIKIERVIMVTDEGRREVILNEEK